MVKKFGLLQLYISFPWVILKEKPSPFWTGMRGRKSVSLLVHKGLFWLGIYNHHDHPGLFWKLAATQASVCRVMFCQEEQGVFIQSAKMDKTCWMAANFQSTSG